MSTEIYLCETTQFQNDLIFQEKLSLLSETRRQKVLSCKTSSKKAGSLAAGLLLNYALKERGLSEKNMLYDCTSKGKPYFPEYPALHFSLSHSYDYALCAVSGNEIGCDIEKKRPANQNIARRFFTQSEQSYISHFNDPMQRQTAFYRLWTMKESLLKTIGCGLTIPLDCFSIEIPDAKEPTTESETVNMSSHPLAKAPDGSLYIFEEYSALSDYCISCCQPSETFRSVPIQCLSVGTLFT